MNNGLPQGWAEIELRECVDVLDNERVPVNSDERAKRQGDVPYYGATGQVGWIDEALFNEELLLIGEDGAPFFDKSKPISYIIRGKSWVNNHAHVLRVRPNVSSNQYLKHFLDSFDFHEFVNGTTRLKLTQGAMNRVPVRLPPLGEQRRMVAKLEKLLGKVDACQERLAKIPVLLKRFRQSVLAAACSGRLTADWRDENPRCLPPPAKPQSNESDVNFLTEDLPDGWQVQRVDHAATIIDCLHKTPKYADSGYPMVRVTDVKGGYLDLSSARLVSEEVFREFTRRYTPRRGDIVFSRVGSFGNVSYVGSDMKFCLGQNTAIISPNTNSRFLHLSLQSPTVRDQMDAAAVGTSQPTISLKSISALAVPIPPLAEQQEIVRRVEALFALSDQIEARYAKAKAHVEKLTQSILAKAFRGELVPQDPNDEPAEALLRRIRQQSKNGKKA